MGKKRFQKPDNCVWRAKGDNYLGYMECFFFVHRFWVSLFWFTTIGLFVACYTVPVLIPGTWYVPGTVLI